MSMIDIPVSVLAQAQGGESALMGLLPIILMFVILYFLMIRPQMKKQREHRNMVNALAKGDEVITAGGIVGKVTDVRDNYITVDIATDPSRPMEIHMQKVAVQALLPKGTIKSL